MTQWIVVSNDRAALFGRQRVVTWLDGRGVAAFGWTGYSRPARLTEDRAALAVKAAQTQRGGAWCAVQVC